MATISHEIKINASRSTVFNALNTREGMQGWHTADVQGDGSVGSVWQLGFSGQLTFEWEVIAAELDERVEWRCVSGPGDSPGTTVQYILSDAPNGQTLVVQEHSGWASEEDNFRKCNTLWGVLLHHLQQYAESNQARPAYE